MSDMNIENKEMNQVEDSVMYKERKCWVLFGLPFTFTVYTFTNDLLTIDQGFFKRDENDCYMYKIQDVEYTASLMERMAGLGTITCYTGDTTHPKLTIQHIKHAKEIKNFILSTSEKARIKRRTMNTLNIGALSDDIDLADID